jgi:hypothetical protein
VPEESRAVAAGPALVALARGTLPLDDDDLSAATRRGLLLAAASGDPQEAVGPGSRAVLETAAELADLGVGPPLGAALAALAVEAGELQRARAALIALAGDRELRLESLAVLLLHESLE